jgi:serine/threonine protein kinase
MTDNLERYTTISTLGSGGMATVVLAEDTLLGRQVALKRVTAIADSRDISRLRREALVGASVSHQNLVSIYDVVTTDDGNVVIVMEYVPGETLADALSREGRLAPAEALRILDGVAAGLDAIHQRDIVHRDVKPANVLLGAGGTVKLADLGIAAVADRTRITSAGAVVGSWRYMAPEQLEDKPSTPAIDVYALAAVAFEVLSGQRARGEQNPMALAHAITTQPPPDLRDAWPEAPPGVAELLALAMARNPSERPGTAGELTRRLRGALEPQTTAQHRVPPARPPRALPVPAGAPSGRAGGTPILSGALDGPGHSGRRRGVFALVALAVVAAAVVVALVSSGGSNPPPQLSSSTHHRSHGRKHNPGGTSTKAASAGSAGTTSAGTASAGTASAGTGTAAATSGRTTTAGSGTGVAPPASTSAKPVGAVESFYHLAAAHNYGAAWALADPALRNQLGGYQSFQAGQAQDRSITFDSAQVTSQSGTGATVAVRTTSARSNGVQHCSGTVDLVPGGSGGQWLLHQIHISC